MIGAGDLVLLKQLWLRFHMHKSCINRSGFILLAALLELAEAGLSVAGLAPVYTCH